MDPAVRIGAVSYLNTKPLIHDLDELAPAAELVLDVPGRLAELLERGDLDVALIPVIEYFRHGGYRVVPDIAIASHGPVLSVTLFSRLPWPQIRRVALDAVLRQGRRRLRPRQHLDHVRRLDPRQRHPQSERLYRRRRR